VILKNKKKNKLFYFNKLLKPIKKNKKVFRKLKFKKKKNNKIKKVGQIFIVLKNFIKIKK